MVTYEDPQYTADDVVDVTKDVRRDGQSTPKIFVPRSRLLRFTLPEQTSAGLPFDTHSVLERLLEQYSEVDRPGRFRVISSETAFHVVPAGPPTSILTTPVSVAIDGTLEQALQAVLNAVQSATGVEMLLGSFPVNLFESSRIRLAPSAGQGTARDVLTRILGEMHLKFSWLLSYDFTFRQYVFNVHIVPLGHG